MRAIVLILLALAALAAAPGAAFAADQAATATDIVTAADGSAVHCRVLAISAEGRISMQAGGAVSETNLASVTQIILGNASGSPPTCSSATATLHLADGSRITGRMGEISGETAVVENDCLTVSVRRRAITCITFGANRAPLPRNGAESDIIVLFDAPGEKIQCKVLLVGEYAVKFRIGRAAHTAARGRVIAVAPAGSEAPPRGPEGWYAAVLLVNGDRLVGTIEKMDNATLTILTRCAGEITLKRGDVERMNFSPSPAYSPGGFLVSDPRNGRVALFDGDGNKLWECKNVCAGCDALELPDGGVVAVSDFVDRVKVLAANGGEVRTVRPALKRIVSAALMDNGDWLVAVGAGGSLAEVTPGGHIVRRFFQGQIRPDPVVRMTLDGEVLLVDGKDRVSRWLLEENRMTCSITVNGVLGAADLGGGRTAVAVRDALIVFDADGKEIWRVKAAFTQFRRVGICVTREGTILIPTARSIEDPNPQAYETVVEEYSRDGEKLGEIPLEDSGFPVSSLRQTRAPSPLKEEKPTSPSL